MKHNRVSKIYINTYNPILAGAAEAMKKLMPLIPAPYLVDMHTDMVRNNRRAAARTENLPREKAHANTVVHNIRNATSTKSRKIVTPTVVAPRAKNTVVTLPINTDAYRHAKIAGEFIVKYPNAMPLKVQIVTVRGARDYIAARRNVRRAMEVYFNNDDENISDTTRAARWLNAVVAELDAESKSAQTFETAPKEMGMNAMFFSVESEAELYTEYQEEYLNWFERKFGTELDNARKKNFDYNLRMEQDWILKTQTEIDKTQAILDREDMAIDKIRNDREQKRRKAEQQRQFERNYAEYSEWLEYQLACGRHWVK